MPLGLHISTAGGVSGAVGRAAVLGCECLQVFGRNPRMWRPRAVSDEEAARFREERRRAGLAPVAVHTPYLVNLSSPDGELFSRSVRVLAEELRTARKLGAEFLVTHPGSTRGRGSAYGRERLTEAVTEARDGTGDADVEILIENTAGGGSRLGGDLAEIGAVIEECGGLGVGLCFDTCHGFAAGYPMRHGREVDGLVRRIDSEAGLENLRLVHLNDSRGGLGSGLDRHEHIGRGEIGGRGLAAFVAHPAVAATPMILETPKESDRDDLENLAAVRAFRDAAKPAGRRKTR